MHALDPVETGSTYPEVHLPDLDAEHRALGIALRSMLDAMSHDDAPRTLALARELAAKVQEHFAHEERLMREIGYANLARHAHTHEMFLAEARLHLELARTRGLSTDVLRWAGQLDEWFHRHVRTEDMWLALAVKAARAAERATSSR